MHVPNHAYFPRTVTVIGTQQAAHNAEMLINQKLLPSNAHFHANGNPPPGPLQHVSPALVQNPQQPPAHMNNGAPWMS